MIQKSVGSNLKIREFHILIYKHFFYRAFWRRSTHQAKTFGWPHRRVPSKIDDGNSHKMAQKGNIKE
jgi:hypothetical protein